MPISISRNIALQPSHHHDRNALCYCGSGKKYKKCHLPLEQHKESLMLSKQGKIRKLIDWYMDQSWYTEMLEIRIRNMVGPTTCLDESDFICIQQILIFEDQVNNMGILEYAITNAPLSKEEKAYYQRWQDLSLFSFFVVEDVRLNESVSIRDALDTTQPYQVIDRSMSQEVQIGDIVIGRLLPHEDVWIMAGDGRLLPSQALPELQRIAKKMTSRPTQAMVMQQLLTGKM